MSTPVTTIRNIGPAQQAALARAGIHDAETLRTLGADAAYARLLDAGSSPHFIMYYVLHMSLQGRRWNDCKGVEKDALRVSFDAIKAERAGHGLSELERELNRIGVGLRR